MELSTRRRRRRHRRDRYPAASAARREACVDAQAFVRGDRPLRGDSLGRRNGTPNQLYRHQNTSRWRSVVVRSAKIRITTPIDPITGDGGSHTAIVNARSVQRSNLRICRVHRTCIEHSLMILPQVHLRKPCYDFYFL